MDWNGIYFDFFVARMSNLARWQVPKTLCGEVLSSRDFLFTSPVSFEIEQRQHTLKKSKRPSTVVQMKQGMISDLMVKLLKLQSDAQHLESVVSTYSIDILATDSREL